MKLYNIVNLLAVTTTADVMRVIRIICVVLLAVCAIAFIVLVLLQPAASEGMGALSGQSYDSFYSKNKVRTPEGIMKRLTIVLCVVTALLIILYFITRIWMND